jgi:hypothetical protein
MVVINYEEWFFSAVIVIEAVLFFIIVLWQWIEHRHDQTKLRWLERRWYTLQSTSTMLESQLAEERCKVRRLEARLGQEVG